MNYTTFLIAVCTLLGRGDADCNRAFSPPPADDCTTCTGAVGATDEIPCYVYPGAVALEFPQENTRTCYRTCHTDDTPQTCQATLTGVHNQNINTNPYGSTSTLQVLFSPNYNDDKDYRKSTICRYDVTCPAGMCLAYMFADHVLENRTDTCVTPDKCVDYVHVTFPSSTEEVTSCGQEPDLNALFADGYGALYAEFYANRHEQAAGFSMDVICYDPEFPPSRRRRQSAGSERCTRVSNAKRPTVDREAQLCEVLASQNPESRASIVADLHRNSSRRRLIIQELESLYYNEGRLFITRRRARGGSRVQVAHDINVLYVSSRFAKSKTMHGSCRTRFPGYAELYIRGHRAYLHRLGINPEFKPTVEELEVISLLNKAVTKKLKCIYFINVHDDLDDEEEPDACNNNFVEDPKISELALQYGNACNSFLRSAACSYQAQILQRDCTTGDELIATSNTIPPTTSQTSATSDQPTSVPTDCDNEGHNPAAHTRPTHGPWRG